MGLQVKLQNIFYKAKRAQNLVEESEFIIISAACNIIPD